MPIIKKSLLLALVFLIACSATFGLYKLTTFNYDKCQSPNLKFDYYIGESFKDYYLGDTTGMAKTSKEAAKVVLSNRACFDPNLFNKMISVSING